MSPIGKFFKKLLGGSSEPPRHFDETDDELQYVWRRREHLSAKERITLFLEFASRALPISAPRPSPSPLPLDERLRPETLPDAGAALVGSPVTIHAGGRVEIAAPSGRVGIELPVWWPLPSATPAGWESLDGVVTWDRVEGGFATHIGGASVTAVRAGDDLPWSLLVDTSHERILVGPAVSLELIAHPSGRPSHIVGSLALPDEAQMARMLASWEPEVSDELIASWVVADASEAIPLWSQSMLQALGFTAFFCADRLPCNPDLQPLVADAISADAAALDVRLAQTDPVHLLAAVGWLVITGASEAADLLLRRAEAEHEERGVPPEVLFARAGYEQARGDAERARSCFQQAADLGYGRAWSNLAAMRAAEGALDEALEMAEKAKGLLQETITDHQSGTEHLRLHHPATMHLLTVLRWARGDRDGAFEAIQLASRELSPWMAELLETLVDEGRPEDHPLPLTSVHVGLQEALVTAGYLTHANGSEGALALAAALLQRAIHADPHFFEATVILADLRFAQGDSTEGQQLLDEALERAPLSSRLYAVVAERASETSDHRKAAAAWGRAFELAPEEGWLRLNQCLAWGAAGDLDQASQVLEDMTYDQVDVRAVAALRRHLAGRTGAGELAAAEVVEGGLSDAETSQDA